MKTITKSLICIVLCLSLSFGASATEPVGIGDSFTSFFDSVVRFFSIIIGEISDLFEGGYTRIDIEKYTEQGFEIPGLESGFVPQGLCYSEKLGAYLISGYTDGGNSKIYTVDEKTNETKEIILKDYTAHAGGIAAGGNNIWICSGGNAEKGGKLYHFTADAIAQAESGDEIAFDSKTDLAVKGSFLGCGGDMIWVGEFYTDGGDYEVNPDHAYGKNHAWACGYSVDSDGKLRLEAVISVPDEVQGMSVLSDNTVIFSTSYGRYNDSALQIYSPYTEWEKSTVTVDGKETDFYACTKSNRIAKIKMPTLMQGIECKGNNLYTIFESGAEKYSNAKKVITNAYSINIDSILKNIDIKITQGKLLGACPVF